MFVPVILAGQAIPSGFFMLLGFFALIILAIAIWNSPQESGENKDNLNPGRIDGNDGKK